MKQIGLAILNYESTNRRFPYAYTPNFGGKFKPGPCPPIADTSDPPNKLHNHNVLSFILPYIEQKALFDQIDFSRNWDDWQATGGRTPNNKVVKVDIPDFVCPSAPARINTAASDYAVLAFINEAPYCTQEAAGLATTKRDVTSLKGLLDEVPVAIRNVTDGLSKTFMFFEDAGRPLIFVKGNERSDLELKPGVITGLYSDTGAASGAEWANKGQYFGWGNEPASYGCGLTTVMNCTNDNDVYGFHPGGCVFLYGDGAANFVSESIDFDTYVSLITRAAGDIARQL
jgi:hypothetical protein